MSDIVRAWKDEAYRQSLSVEEQSMLPANPAGEIELTDTELEAVYGAQSGCFEAADYRQWEYSGFFVQGQRRNRVSGGNGDGGGLSPRPGSSGTPGTGPSRISNTNTNTATSTSTSTATGGSALVSTGAITITL